MFSLARLVPLILFYYKVTRVDGGNTESSDNVDEDKFKIVGGKPVTQGKKRYPWFARAEVITENGSKKWSGCGGSLVSREHVLTAAHCIDDTFIKSGGYMIGSLCTDEINDSNCDQPQDWRTVQDVFIHPYYDEKKRMNDFAIVRLNAPTTIKYVRMDEGKSTTYKEGTKLWAVGYGKTKIRGSITGEGVLHHVRMNYQNNEECNNILNEELEHMNISVDITDDMMCVADRRKASCQGDSGGPLYNRRGGVLVGIVSWGLPSCDKGYPGVYARVGTEYDWLANTICDTHEFPQPNFCEDYFIDDTFPDPFSPPTNPPVNPPTPPPTNPPVNPPTPPPKNPPSDSPTPLPTNPPSKSPTPRPTNPPVNSPTPPPINPPVNSPTPPLTNAPVKRFNPFECDDNIECDDDHVKFKIILRTDDKPKEIKYNLKKRNARKKWSPVLEEIGLDQSAEQCSQLCISEGSYKFTIKAGGDGLCCDYGNGGFEYFINDELEVSSIMEGRSKEKTKFDIGRG